MITAILEISFMLIVALLIGMFIAWRYWRKKFLDLQESGSKTIREQREKIASIEIVNEQHIKRNGELKEKSDQQEKTIKAGKDEISVLKAEIADLKSQQHEKEKQISELKEQSGELKVSIDSLAADLDQEKNQHKKTREETSSLKSSLEKLRKDQDSSQNEVKSLKQPTANQTISKDSDKDHSYYRMIEGKKYKNEPITMAEVSVKGQGDGRISKSDAEKIFAVISDGHQYTEVEKNTMKYIRDNFKWTEQADELFRHEVRVWAAKGHKLE